MGLSKSIRNLLVIAGVLAGTGYLRMSYEQKLTEDFRERRIMQPQIKSKIWSQMGQTSLAGAFGGLRTVMASMVFLDTQSHFEENEWFDLEKDYQVITALDPYNGFYWDHGGWQLGYNAASWARTNRRFSPAKRRFLERQYLEKGDAFYREGLEYLPEEHRLWFEIGAMWSNPYKQPDLERAAEAFKVARRSRNPVHRRRYLFTIARIPGRELEAYQEALRLYEDSPEHLKSPTFRCLIIVLSSNPDLPAGTRRPMPADVYRRKEKAYQDLYNYRQRVLDEDFYAGNIDEILKSLIIELDVPDELNPFVSPGNQRIHTEFWREAYERKKEREELRGDKRKRPDWLPKELR